jgi:F0F1-type ATP synthase assembly protein I
MKRLGQIVGTATELGLTMGLTAAGLVALGLVVGRWLDARLGTDPVATILLTVAGAVAGQIALYRLARASAARLAAPQARLALGRDGLSAVGLALGVLALLVLPGLAGLALGLLLGGEGWLTPVLVIAGFGLGLLGILVLLRRRVGPTGGERP